MKPSSIHRSSNKSLQPANTTHAGVVITAVQRGDPRGLALLERELPNVRLIRDVECRRAVGEHQVVEVFDRVLARRRSLASRSKRRRTLAETRTASVQKMPQPLPFQYALCKRCATLYIGVIEECVSSVIALRVQQALMNWKHIQMRY